jgi:hypothetical protein
MIKIYSIGIDECRDCPNHRYQSGMMEHSWCKETGDEILVSELNNDPHFPSWCPLKTHDERIA